MMPGVHQEVGMRSSIPHQEMGRRIIHGRRRLRSLVDRRRPRSGTTDVAAASKLAPATDQKRAVSGELAPVPAASPKAKATFRSSRRAPRR
jgi:hypothetical protein